jgi:hypothetical protein
MYMWHSSNDCSHSYTVRPSKTNCWRPRAFSASFRTSGESSCMIASNSAEKRIKFGSGTVDVAVKEGNAETKIVALE